MCLQCEVNPIWYGEVIPGWYLARAGRPHRNWQRWGLINYNDPSFTWEVDPIPSPTEGMTDEELDAWEGDDWPFIDGMSQFDK